ncbi:MAG TPA: hypothetical protein VMS17_26560 [Gemmataceae bacterium]|nr:hypothetical protein [Gemmataceae bacterium]
MTPTADLLFADLPGPTRQRTRSRYSFRLTYRSCDAQAAGCVLLWEVGGGRMPYQIAVERDEHGGLTWHCTCADHVYRHEDIQDFQCKHVRALRGRRYDFTGTEP